MHTITDNETAINNAITAEQNALARLNRADNDTDREHLAHIHQGRVHHRRTTIRTALAEVVTACEERIGMWEKTIARSSDDDEIRDAQAAASELRWLVLQLNPKENTR